MIKNLLLSTLISVGVGTSALIPLERISIPTEGSNFRLLSEFFPNYEIVHFDSSFTFSASLTKSQALSLPELNFDYLFIGEFTKTFISDLTILNSGLPEYYAIFEKSYDLNVSFPFVGGYLTDGEIVDSEIISPYLFSRRLAIDFANLHGTYNISITFDFTNNLAPQQIARFNQMFIEQVGFANGSAIVDYIEQEKNISYVDGAETSEGTWLGNMIFGTIGGMVGFLFAVSDFEVLGVSIMSIITLFVAISVVLLLIKAIK